jgi:hypothetical protein
VEIELHVCSWFDLGLLGHRLADLTVDNLVFDRIFLDDSPTDVARFLSFLAKVDHKILAVGDVLEATVEVSPHRLNLAEVDNRWHHETKQVESHLLFREGAYTVLLDTFSDDIVTTHKPSATRSADDSTADGEVAAPAL